jgi:hypothetical protein
MTSLPDLKRAVQARLAQKYGLTIDGEDGPKTWTAIATELDCLPPPPDTRNRPWLAIPQEAFDLILHSEGIDQPWKWPGLDSGISIGPGFDLSSETRAEVEEAWSPYLSADQIRRLQVAVGVSGQAARAIAPNFRDITVTRAQSDDVFYRVIVPKYYRQMASAFPGVERLPGPAQGALLSCGYNRGWSTRDSVGSDRRREMAHIKSALATNQDVNTKVRIVASQLRSMERLWADNPNSFDDLHDRREKEARLAESALA